MSDKRTLVILVLSALVMAYLIHENGIIKTGRVASVVLCAWANVIFLSLARKLLGTNRTLFAFALAATLVANILVWFLMGRSLLGVLIAWMPVLAVVLARAMQIPSSRS